MEAITAAWPFGTLRPHAYRQILVDPAYKFSSGPSRNPSNHFVTMPIAAIAAMPIGELAHPDGCRLFLWITVPLLNRFPELLKACGFTYKSARVWLKLRQRANVELLTPKSFVHGTGYEVWNSTEILIIAKHGKPQPLGGNKPVSHIIAARREHSRKPDCVRDEIAALFDGPRCEPLARSRHPAFDSWGDQVDLFDGAAA
jgi:N6-adenosine-specific RNA methylase IME4